VIVGGHASSCHAEPRFTKDLYLIRNKRAAGRPQDLVDADKLRAYAKKK
jgi:hypothetical protein